MVAAKVQGLLADHQAFFFFSQKHTIKYDPNIILKQAEKSISDQQVVSKTMNFFYINTVKNIDINSTALVNGEHPNIKHIKEQHPNQNFEFKTITEKQDKNLTPRKQPEKIVFHPILLRRLDHH